MLSINRVFTEKSNDMTQPQALSIIVDEKRRVSGLMQVPRAARVCYVLAHGAGAGMSHPFMTAVADGLAERDIATLRYQFPYMEEGGKRPDTPKIAHATVGAAVAKALQLLPGLAVVACGKSFGGRMTSQAQAASPCPAFKAWCSSVSRCIPRDVHRTSVERIYSRSKFQCCFYRGPVIRSQRPN